MAKLIYSMLTSLDGFVEDADLVSAGKRLFPAGPRVDLRLAEQRRFAHCGRASARERASPAMSSP